MNVIILTPEPGDAGSRMDSFVSGKLEDVSRSAAQRILTQGRVTVGGKPADKNARVKTGDIIEVNIPDPVPLDAVAQDIPLDVVYEDDALLVVNKPRGMVVHPAAGHRDGTLVNALLAHCGDSLSGIGGVSRPGIVHRLDKDTSGLLIVAKTDRAHKGLALQIKEHTFARIYHAVAHGRIKTESGTIDAPIARHPTERKRMAVVASGRPAVTHYRVLQEFKGFTYLECALETGRTHQIRVHLASLGHPVAGDLVYCPKKGPAGLLGQCLHAKAIAFNHPITNERLEFDAPLPPCFTDFLKKLEGQTYGYGK